MRSYSLIFSLLLLTGALLLPRTGEAGRPVSCPDVLFPAGACAPDVGAALETCCPCDGFRNHGRYVRCRAHAINALRKADCLDRDARRTLKRCVPTQHALALRTHVERDASGVQSQVARL